MDVFKSTTCNTLVTNPGWDKGGHGPLARLDPNSKLTGLS